MSFDTRWRRLAEAARLDGSSTSRAGALRRSLAPAALAPDLARLARSRAPEPVPLVGPRVGRALAAASIAISVAALSLAAGEPADRASAQLVLAARLPTPPSLPRPPSVAPPDHYLALARTAWRELSP